MNLQWLRRKLERETSSGQLIREIDGLRFLAITSVVAFHLVEYLQAKMKTGHYPAMPYDGPTNLVHHGFIGVELFFMISGFVVAMPFAKHFLLGAPRMPLKYYYLRRITRLEPPYLIALAFWFTFFAITGLGPAPVSKMLQHLPAALTYSHLAVYHELNVIYPAAWSLEMEAQFYLVAPLLVLAFAIRQPWLRRSVLLTATLGMGLAQYWLRPGWQGHGESIQQNLHYFLAGFVLLDLYLTVWTKPSRVPWPVWDVLATLAFAAVPVLLFFHRPQHVPLSALAYREDNVTIPILFLLGCTGVFRGHFWRTAARNPWVYLTGGMCYTIYLYHLFFIGVAGLITLHLHVGDRFWVNFCLQLLVILPIVIGASAGVFLVTEKPFMRRDWPARLWRWITGRPLGTKETPPVAATLNASEVKEFSSST